MANTTSIWACKGIVLVGLLDNRYMIIVYIDRDYGILICALLALQFFFSRSSRPFTQHTNSLEAGRIPGSRTRSRKQNAFPEAERIQCCVHAHTVHARTVHAHISSMHRT